MSINVRLKSCALATVCTGVIMLAGCSGSHGNAASDASGANPGPQVASSGENSADSPNTSGMPDTSRTVPNGTLTWKIVYTGRASQPHDIPGPEADVATSTTDIRWEVDGNAKLAGEVANGALDHAGADVADKVVAPASAPSPVDQIASQCGDDQACAMAAMMKLAHNSGAIASLQAQANAAESVVGRIDMWTSNDPGRDTTCRMTAKGTLTSDWHGNARFGDHGPIVPIGYSVHEDTRGSSSVDCTGDSSSGVQLQADPVAKVYNLSLPGMRAEGSQSIAFTTTGSKPDNTSNQMIEVALPPITLKGMSWPTSFQMVHGERTLQHIASIPAAAREVRIHDPEHAVAYEYAEATNRPAIPLDAEVTWAFTPDQH